MAKPEIIEPDRNYGCEALSALSAIGFVAMDVNSEWVYPNSRKTTVKLYSPHGDEISISGTRELFDAAMAACRG